MWNEAPLLAIRRNESCEIVTWIVTGVIGESVSNLAVPLGGEMNRPVRTRTPGGVGGASE